MEDKQRIILSFDLDFTLIDNREGIINSFNYALQKYHIPAMDDSKIEKMIGTPLEEMFSKVSNLKPSLLSIVFREYYSSDGIYQVKLIPGALERLDELKSDFLLGIITSKKQEMAVKLLKYLNIDYYFDFIIGETSEFKTKVDLKLKEYLLKEYPNCDFVVIGDHLNDKMLAENLGCPFIGVLTGFHTPEQLKQGDHVKTIILNSIKEIAVVTIYSLF